MPIRLIVADDSLLVREGIVRVLGLEPDFEVVALCADHPELMAAVERERPDVVVTDIRMPPAGTETDKTENARLYERFGLVVTAEAKVLGVPNWFMAREARTPGT